MNLYVFEDSSFTRLLQLIDAGPPAVWSWVEVPEGTRSESPTLSFSTDLAVLMAKAILENAPTEIDAEILRALHLEQERVDRLINVITSPHEVTLYGGNSGTTGN